MRTGVKLRVMKRYCARGYWNNLHMEMLFQPIDFWEAGSISTLDNNKAKYSSRKHCRQNSWRKKVHCELSGLFFQYLTMYTSLWEILDLIPFTTSFLSYFVGAYSLDYAWNSSNLAGICICSCADGFRPPFCFAKKEVIWKCDITLKHFCCAEEFVILLS